MGISNSDIILLFPRSRPPWKLSESENTTLMLTLRYCIFIPRVLTGIRKFSRQHGQITKGALKGLSDANPREIGPHVSTISVTYHRTFTHLVFRKWDGRAPFLLLQFSLLIQRSSLRIINNVFSLVVREPLDLISGYTINRVLSSFRTFHMTVCR